MIGNTGVFVSYARKDGEHLAQHLKRDLEVAGFDVWLDTERIGGGATWGREIEYAIDRSEVVLALLTQGSYVSDICRAEQLHALRKGKVVIPILAAANTDVPLHLEAKNYRDLSNDLTYAPQLRLLITDIRAGNEGIRLREEFRRTSYVTVPPLPRNFIALPHALERLRDAVMRADSGPTISLTALLGMGGVGKTVLAQALSRDQVIQDALPDGIVWTTVGKEPIYDLVTRVREVRRGLGDEPGRDESELECINRYRTVVRQRASLIIVDDVWGVEDLEPFIAESPRSRLLFTSRDASIAAAVGAVECAAELPSEEHTRALLARWAGLDADDLPGPAADIIHECGRLPLAITMIGASLRNKPVVGYEETARNAWALTANPVTSPRWRIWGGFAVFSMSQIFNVPSLEAEIAFVPAPLRTTFHTQLEWPSSVYSSSPASRFQTLSVLSLHPPTASRPSALISMPNTRDSVTKSRIFKPRAISQTVTV
jgi:hypothetical protein